MADKYINANKLKENIKAEQKNNANMGMSVICDWFIEAINNEPAADVQPIKHGRWIGNEVIQCSNCNFTMNGNAYGKLVYKCFKYCPNCGARMDGEQNDD